jgi:hypothetical protein
MPANPSAETTRPRAERRINVRLPITVKGRDSRGVSFEESTSSENLCRGGAAFITRFEVTIGSDLEILIPFSPTGNRRREPDFLTHGRVVHVRNCQSEGERFVGVQFTGPRFRRVFHSESAA